MPVPPGSTTPPGLSASPGLTPHELRHTAASLAIQAGANVKAAQRMLGHASAAMTLDRYADLFDDDLDDVADRLDALRAATRGRVADLLRTELPHRSAADPARTVKPLVSAMSMGWRRGESNP